MRILYSLPMQLLCAMVLAFFLGKELPLDLIRFFYTISTCFIEILLFLLPIIIFGFILKALIHLEKGATRLLLTIFLAVTTSNLLALLSAYFIAQISLPWLGFAADLGQAWPATMETGLVEPLHSLIRPQFSIGLAPFVGAETALLAGVLYGLLLSFVPHAHIFKIKTRSMIYRLNDILYFFLGKIVLPVLPIYVFGFCLKLRFDDIFSPLFQQYGRVFLLSLSVVWVYIGLLYSIASAFNIQRFKAFIKAMAPAALTAFSTMSSAITMPLTLKAVSAMGETRDGNKDGHYAELIVPTTANIHMLGDNITLTIFSMAFLSLMHMPWPDLTHFLLFSFSFAIAKLSCVGIAGASVFVILPVLQKHLHFTPEMLSMITTLYILQDPFGTTANVCGNGAFSQILRPWIALKSAPLVEKEKEDSFYQ